MSGAGERVETVTRSDAGVLGTVSNETCTAFLHDGEGITFGRATGNDLRIGDVRIDEVVPRFAGRVVAAGHRVAVENLDSRLAFDLRVEGRPLIPVSPGDLHAPRERTFEIVVGGGVTAYALAVVVNVEGTPTRLLPVGEDADDADLPTGPPPQLTDRQRRILDAYVRPMTEGLPVASHQDVADEVGVSRALVRVECRAICSAFLFAGIPMRDFADSRDQIADAWGRHRI